MIGIYLGGFYVADMTLVEQPLLAPGCCFFTQRSGVKNGPYIDTGINLAGYGRVYIGKSYIEMTYNLLPVKPKPQLDEPRYDFDIEKVVGSVLDNYKEEIANAFLSSLADGGFDKPSDSPDNAPSTDGGSKGSKGGKPVKSAGDDAVDPTVKDDGTDDVSGDNEHDTGDRDNSSRSVGPLVL